MGVLLGRADRTFTSVPYARFRLEEGSQVRVVRVMGIDNVFKQSPVLFEEVGTGVYRIEPGDATGAPLSQVIATLDRSPTQLLGTPLAVNIVDGVGRECEEVVWAWKGDDRLRWVQICEPGNALRVDKGDVPKPLFQLPAGDVVTRPPVAVALNADGHVALLVSGEARTYVALGLGDGTFSARPDLAGDAAVAELACDLACLDPTIETTVDAACGPPLAAASGANAAIVFPTFVGGIRAVEPSVRSPGNVTMTLSLLAVAPTDWSLARMADLNGDGLTDVIAGSSARSGLDLLTGTRLGLFNPARIATDAPVSALAVGDYDGDLVHDVGFVESGVGGPSIEAISVAYGNFLAVPAPTLRIGLIPNMQQLETAKVVGLDAVDKLGAIFFLAGAVQVAVLAGGGNRQLTSPYGLTARLRERDVQGAPFFLATGRFDSDAFADVALRAIDDAFAASPYDAPHRWWTANGAGGGRFKAPTMGTDERGFSGFAVPDVARSGRPAFGFAVAAVRSADLDGDGIDEVVVAAPNKDAIADQPFCGVTLTVARSAGSGSLASGATRRPSAMSTSSITIADTSSAPCAGFGGTSPKFRRAVDGPTRSPR
jgi:hypothetical protein